MVLIYANKQVCWPHHLSVFEESYMIISRKASFSISWYLHLLDDIAANKNLGFLSAKSVHRIVFLNGS